MKTLQLTWGKYVNIEGQRLLLLLGILESTMQTCQFVFKL